MSERFFPPYQPTLGLAQQEMLAPGSIEDARISIFGLQADAEAITRFADRFLGGPTGGRYSYVALAPLVLVIFQKAERLSSTSEVVGYIPDKEATFAVLLWEKQRGLHLPRPVLWMPFIFIDNAIGMVTGYNIWGYRKELGRMSIPAPDSEDPYRIDATLFRTFSPETRGELAKLVELRRTRPPEPELARWSDPDAVGGWLLERILGEARAPDSALSSGLGTIKQLLIEHFRPKLPVVNLKQFRDAADGRRACYQSLVRNTLEITRFRRGGLLGGEYRLDITPCASHQITQSLGISGQSDIPVSFGLWVELDYVANPGTEFWRAGD